jgi:hypothetical protein
MQQLLIYDINGWAEMATSAVSSRPHGTVTYVAAAIAWRLWHAVSADAMYHKVMGWAILATLAARQAHPL